MPGRRGNVPYRPPSQASSRSRRSDRRNSSVGGDDANDNHSYRSHRSHTDDDADNHSRYASSHDSRHSRYDDGTRPGTGASVGSGGASSTSVVPVETLVEHLLAARRALGTISQVLRSNELATEARQLYTGAMTEAARTGFLRNGIRQQAAILLQIRRGMSRAYDAGRRDFRMLIRTLDAANEQLEHTMEILRATTVAAVFRPAGEAPRTLLDFVDEAGVEALRDAIKQSIAELQAAQTSFDGDLLRFDTDLRALNKAMAAAPPPPPPLPLVPEDGDSSREMGREDENDGDEPAASPYPVPHLLATLTQRSHRMATNLTSLTRHFDLCVTAVKTTEGGLEMARWKAAAGSGPPQQDPVSISGMIAEHEGRGNHDSGDGGGDGAEADKDAHALQPVSPEERAEMIQVVLQDAAEVDEVVADMAADLHAAEAAFAAVHAHAEATHASSVATGQALAVLHDIGSRLRSYAAAESEFAARWANERAVVADRLADMDELRAFYEGYAHAYDTLILEAERRRTVEAKIQTVWRKARDAVERLVEADRAERANFRQEVGEFLPTDLWQDMDRPPKGVELFASMLEGQQRQRPGGDGDDGHGGEAGQGKGQGMAASAASTTSKSAATKAAPQRKRSPRHDEADGSSVSNSLLGETGTDAGGSSTRTVVGR
ncbi:hypothetical protein SPBR_06882 [Sporothrix brasiliensis 5110]|uniref:Autophagy-related protein 17 n=1 Tax=Sporothrix brasiliensis 5110 TaxID=1398154 RepID=A0A0C2IR43_9PEZI|nr:uncharacterized protein SPBR_06882 [Sporothrix brasiliensis 5110]KIH89350.1 hypothetical protein SPBR_06882 [Sporothrix brasiliensis 5110]